jgi:hypothetical protein
MAFPSTIETDNPNSDPIVLEVGVRVLSRDQLTEPERVVLP